MRLLLSSIGSRGDIQPLLALATALREHGHEARLCLPPDFLADAQRLHFHATPVGPSLRGTATPALTRPTPEQAQQMIRGTVDAQFDAVAQAAEGCDLMLGATALQMAAPSIAQVLGIPYVFAAYSPTVLPSSQHPPPRIPGADAAPPGTPIAEQWQHDAARWQRLWGEPLNARRAAMGLPAIDDVRGYVLTSSPWLAADAWLAPWDDPHAVPYQPGGWMLEDTRPLSATLQAFLDSGEAPLYVGLGSMAVPEGFAARWVDAARRCGRRTVIARGWGGAPLGDTGADVLEIDEANHSLLFPRTCAVVHHGGAGTTLAVARAGVPQIVLPQIYDQPYWGSRITALGLGVSAPSAPADAEACAQWLSRALALADAPAVRQAPRYVQTAGANHAAQRLIALAGGS